MDIKKLAALSVSCSDFDDVEINRIMQDKTARKVFQDVKVILYSRKCDSNVCH